jgi:hypothetical protein
MHVTFFLSFSLSLSSYYLHRLLHGKVERPICKKGNLKNKNKNPFSFFLTILPSFGNIRRPCLGE